MSDGMHLRPFDPSWRRRHIIWPINRFWRWAFGRVLWKRTDWP